LITSGCQPTQPFFYNEDGDLSHYLDMATQVEFPDLESCPLPDAQNSQEPLSVIHADPGQPWDLTLEEVISISLNNSKVIRTIAQVRDPSLWVTSLETFKKGAQVDPTDVRLLDEWGWLHYQLDEYRDAQEVLENAVTIDKEAWSPRSHLAATYFQRTQYEDSIASFKQALELMNATFDADHYCVTAKTLSCDRLVQAYITLGYAYRQLKQCAPSGLGAFRKALIIRPDNPGAQGGYNQCAEDLGTPVPRTPTPRP